MLTEQETSDMHAFVTELEDRCRPADVFTMGRLAAATGDEWETFVRECLAQWRPICLVNPVGGAVGDVLRCDQHPNCPCGGPQQDSIGGK